MSTHFCVVRSPQGDEEAVCAYQRLLPTLQNLCDNRVIPGNCNVNEYFLGPSLRPVRPADLLSMLGLPHPIRFRGNYPGIYPGRFNYYN